MLFIDHDQPWPIQSLRLVKQRVRADENLRGSVSLQQWEETFFLPGRRPQRDPDAERFQPAAQDNIVLFGEYLRRCHQRRLEARFNREQHRGHRHDCFARTDITL